MSRVRVNRAGVVLAGTLLAAIIATADVAPSLAAGLAPFFLLVGLLAFGHFPGEEIIERLRARHRAPRHRRAGDIHPVRRAPIVRKVGRAGDFSLAVRPPPALSVG
jgi:hypothetical protein